MNDEILRRLLGNQTLQGQNPNTLALLFSRLMQPQRQNQGMRFMPSTGTGGSVDPYQGLLGQFNRLNMARTPPAFSPQNRQQALMRPQQPQQPNQITSELLNLLY